MHSDCNSLTYSITGIIVSCVLCGTIRRMLLLSLQEANKHCILRHEPVPQPPAKEPESAAPGAAAGGAARTGGAAEGVCNGEQPT